MSYGVIRISSLPQHCFNYFYEPSVRAIRVKSQDCWFHRESLSIFPVVAKWLVGRRPGIARIPFPGLKSQSKEIEHVQAAVSLYLLNRYLCVTTGEISLVV